MLFFFYIKEWSKERECLLKDLTTIDGKLKTQMPDSSSESYASYLKMMAVYGKIDDMEESTVITEKLGTRKIVYSHDVSTEDLTGFNIGHKMKGI